MTKQKFMAMSLSYKLQMLVEMNYDNIIINEIRLLHGISIIGNSIAIGCFLNWNSISTKPEYCKPILYPLSDYELLNLDITDEIAIKNVIDKCDIIGNLRYSLVERLIEEHFDILGLIETKEAVNVNTLPKNPYNEKKKSISTN